MKKIPTKDIRALNPFYSADNEEDKSNYIKYCPRCKTGFKWIEMIKTPYGWWTCPICQHRCYGGFK